MKKKIIAFCVAVVMSFSFLAVAGKKTDFDSDVKDVSTAVIEQNYNAANGQREVTRDEAADMNGDTVATTAPSTTSSGLGLGDLSGLLGGSGDGGLLGGSGDSGLLGGNGLGDVGSVGEIFSDAGDVIGSIFGNGSSSNNNNSNSQNNIPATQYPVNNPNYIDPVPAATYVQSQTATVATSGATTLTGESETASVSTDSVDLSTTSNPFKKPSEDIKPGDEGDGVKWVEWVLMFTNYGLQGKTVDGVYDDETVAVVKKFQKEQGLTDDGIVNSATVDKLEIMYYRYAMTLTTVPSTVTTTIPQITENEGNEDDKGIPTAAIIAIIAAVWCIAIGVIVALLIIKKKKNNDSKEADNKSSGATNGDMNLSDLFEEANNKK